MKESERKKLQQLLRSPQGRKLAQQALNHKLRVKRALDPEKLLFGPQKRFVLDVSRNKVACCSRRAGKSYALAFIFAEACITHPNSLAVYITKTRELAKEIMWPAFDELAERIGIKLKKNQQTGTVTFPNGSRVLLRGVEDERQIDKLRGPKYTVVAIDEAQAFPYYLKTLIDDVAEPATVDYMGQVVITGTPNAICRGIFYDAVHNEKEMQGWSAHSWTLRDNLPMQAKMLEFSKNPNDTLETVLYDWLESKKAAKGWTEESPQYRREYWGEWVKSYDQLVYRLTPSRNIVDRAPIEKADDWRHLVGMDPGFRDPMALVVLAYSKQLGSAYVVYEHREGELNHYDQCAMAKDLFDQYEADAVIVDSAQPGLVKMLIEKFGLPAIPSDKSGLKASTIEVLNTDLRTSRLFIESHCEHLIEEMSLLQWEEKSMLKDKLKEDKRFMNHLCDAMLYAWRFSRHQTEVTQLGAYEHAIDLLERKLEEEQDLKVAKANGKTSELNLFDEDQWWMLN